MKLFTALAVTMGLAVPSHAGDDPGRKLRVVVFGGHPDDPESGAGGLIATLTRQNHEVICAYGTSFRDDRRFFGRPEAEVRKQEATAACKVLGAKPKFFPYAHEKLVADETTLNEVSTWLAEVKPDIVVTALAARHAPEPPRCQLPGLEVLPASGRLEPLLLRGDDRSTDDRLRSRALPRHRTSSRCEKTIA